MGVFEPIRYSVEPRFGSNRVRNPGSNSRQPFLTSPNAGRLYSNPRVIEPVFEPKVTIPRFECIAATVRAPLANNTKGNAKMTQTVTSGVASAARRMDFYRLAAEHAVMGSNTYMARTALSIRRDDSPPGDPSRAWSDDDLEKIVKRVYATHRRRGDFEDDPAVAS
jgi:hypothetical protein